MTHEIVILAAGLGSRLGRALPKPLTELADGRTIMQQQLENIHAAFDDARISIVVGYKLESIIEAFPENNFVYNEAYDQTNTSKSLLRALTNTPKNEGVLWMNGDVVFDPQILVQAAALIEANQSFVTVNTAKVSDEEVKYTINAEGYIDELSKTVPQASALGEAVGINYIAGHAKQKLINQLKAVDDQAYFERGIELAIQYDGLLVEPMDISVRNYYAVEVDFAADLTVANAALK